MQHYTSLDNTLLSYLPRELKVELYNYTLNNIEITHTYENHGYDGILLFITIKMSTLIDMIDFTYVHLDIMLPIYVKDLYRFLQTYTIKRLISRDNYYLIKNNWIISIRFKDDDNNDNNDEHTLHFSTRISEILINKLYSITFCHYDTY